MSFMIRIEQYKLRMAHSLAQHRLSVPKPSRVQQSRSRLVSKRTACIVYAKHKVRLLLHMMPLCQESKAPGLQSLDVPHCRRPNSMWCLLATSVARMHACRHGGSTWRAQARRKSTTRWAPRQWHPPDLAQATTARCTADFAPTRRSPHARPRAHYKINTDVPKSGLQEPRRGGRCLPGAPSRPRAAPACSRAGHCWRRQRQQVPDDQRRALAHHRR